MSFGYGNMSRGRVSRSILAAGKEAMREAAREPETPVPTVVVLNGRFGAAGLQGWGNTYPHREAFKAACYEWGDKGWWRVAPNEQAGCRDIIAALDRGWTVLAPGGQPMTESQIAKVREMAL